jgi:hypothetical protein
MPDFEREPMASEEITHSTELRTAVLKFMPLFHIDHTVQIRCSVESSADGEVEVELTKDSEDDSLEIEVKEYEYKNESEITVGSLVVRKYCRLAIASAEIESYWESYELSNDLAKTEADLIAMHEDPTIAPHLAELRKFTKEKQDYLLGMISHLV